VPAVLYHSDCPDGFTAAWAAYEKFGAAANYCSVRFDDDERPELTGVDVYIVDFSYPRDITLAIKEEANSLVVLDHHKSARERLEGIEGCYFDMDRSGAGMAWDYFHPDVPRPPLISYVEDRDLWRFALPDSKAINAAITSYEFSFLEWQRLSHRLQVDFQALLAEGVTLLRSKNRYVKIMEKTYSRTASFLGYEGVRIVNAPHISISELVNRLAEDAPFAVGWRQAADGKFLYSLRSIGRVDVSEVASVLGGGGHRDSSGFDSPLPPWELEVDVKAQLDRLLEPDSGDDIALAIASERPPKIQDD
jgi:hypothetical protein